jgi:hypothetical protein
LVYISEAHARDEWPVGDPIIIDQPKTLSKRLEIANGFRDFFDFPNDFNIVVDNPETNDRFDACKLLYSHIYICQF